MVPRVVPTAVAALGLVLLVVGIVMLTVAAPSRQVGGSTGADRLLLTAPGVLALTGGRLELVVADEAFVGIGRAAEVEAWAEGVALARVTGLRDELTLAVQQVDGVQPEAAAPVADPTLADIWQQELPAGDELTVASPQADDVLVVVADDPTDVTLTWQRQVRHPGAWPLVGGGLFELVVGVAWLVLLNAGRARRRPRRGRRAAG